MPHEESIDHIKATSKQQYRARLKSQVRHGGIVHVEAATANAES
jgi:hypothetical protein